jgi:hypothetical protein
VANAMLEEYLRRDQKSSLKEIRAAKSFVEKERQRAQKQLAQSERELLHFRRRHHVAQLTTEQESRTKELVDLESHYRDDAAAIMRTAAQMSQVRAQLGREPALKRVPVGHPNPRQDALSVTLTQLETQRAALLAQYREHTPAVVIINAQIQRVKQRLAAEPAEQAIPLTTPNPAYDEMRTRLNELERDLNGLHAERAELSAQLASERERMYQLGPWEVQLAQLTRAAAVAEKSFLMLDEKLQELTIRENVHVSPARIAQYAVVPIEPVFPRKGITLVIAAMLGIMTGLVAAFLQEHLDDSLHTPEEASRAPGLPALGLVPASRANVRAGRNGRDTVKHEGPIPGKGAQRMVAGRPRVGSFLLQRGLLSEAQLEAAIAYQVDNECRLGEALIARGFCTDREIAQALAEQLEIPYVDLEEIPPAPDCIALLPHELAITRGVLPLRKTGNRLLVAVQNPFDIHLDEAVRQVTPLQVVLAIAPESQLLECLRRHYNETLLEEAQTPPKEELEEPGLPCLRH